MSRLAIGMMGGAMLFGRGSSCWRRRGMRAGGATMARGIIRLGCRISSTRRRLCMWIMGVGVSVLILLDCSWRRLGEDEPVDSAVLQESMSRLGLRFEFVAWIPQSVRSGFFFQEMGVRRKVQHLLSATPEQQQIISAKSGVYVQAINSISSSFSCLSLPILLYIH